MNSNCKDCTERHPGCHDNCESYQKYKAERRLISENRAKSRIRIQYSDNHKKDMIDAHRKNF